MNCGELKNNGHDCDSTVFIREAGAVFCGKCFWHFNKKEKMIVDVLVTQGVFMLKNAKNYESPPISEKRRQINQNYQRKNAQSLREKAKENYKLRQKRKKKITKQFTNQGLTHGNASDIAQQSA